MGLSWTTSVLQERPSVHVTLDLCKSNHKDLQNAYYSHSIFVHDHTSLDPMCWSMRSHVVSHPQLLIYASRKCDNSAIPVGQASCGADIQVVDKFLSCSLETWLCNQWWISSKKSCLRSKKVRRTCHTFTAINIGSENQQTPNINFAFLTPTSISTFSPGRFSQHHPSLEPLLCCGKAPRYRQPW